MIKSCRLIELPKFSDERGSLSFLENDGLIPFQLERIYYLYDVPEGQARGAHGHRDLEQLIIAISGSFQITLHDGFEERTYSLDRPSVALYVTPMMWRDIRKFSPDAVCLVLASAKFDADDYLHEFEAFVKIAKASAKDQSQ